MSFFNEPLIIITPLGDSSLEANVPVEVPFYFTDINDLYVLADVAIEYYIYTKTGRDIVNLTSLTVATTDTITSSVYTSITVPTTVKDVVYFMFKVTINNVIYWISSEPFNIIKPGV